MKKYRADLSSSLYGIEVYAEDEDEAVEKLWEYFDEYWAMSGSNDISFLEEVEE